MLCQLFLTAYGISDVYASVDIAGTTTDPNDTYYDQQKDVYELIQLPEAWEDVDTSNIVYVGVIDSGIDAEHPDLDGIVDTVKSESFVDEDFIGSTLGPEYDHYGHGTHVAGIIAAIRDNNLGIAGICDNVKLVSLRVASSDGRADLRDVIDAIIYAESENIRILNISYGFERERIIEYYGSENAEELITDFYEAISDYNGLIICSAGNGNMNIDTNPVYPASFDLDNILVVGASSFTSNTETVWSESSSSGSNFGSVSVDIFAPGDSIISCYSQDVCQYPSCSSVGNVHAADDYHILSGTSMATPIVTGVAALILGKFTQLSPINMKERILTHCDVVAVFSGKCVSGGRLNAFRALCDHRYTYSIILGSGSHNCVCSICGFSTLEAHSWQTLSTTPPKFKCTVCGYLTTNISALRMEEEILFIS